MPGKLTPYQRKRDFSRTPEPAGQVTGQPAGTADHGEQRFVVQRHRARRLHYDLRLEIDGVLVSWAVPKGPTLDPAVRRAAVHVEDHPMEYFDFEGVIPRGEYGGGDVIVWDGGTWEPHAADDPGRRRSRRASCMSTCTGRSWRQVRPGAHPAGRSDQWLLLHKHDEDAVTGWDPEDHPGLGAERAHQRRGQGRPRPDVAVRSASRRSVGDGAPPLDGRPARQLPGARCPGPPRMSWPRWTRWARAARGPCSAGSCS